MTIKQRIYKLIRMTGIGIFFGFGTLILTVPLFFVVPLLYPEYYEDNLLGFYIIGPAYLTTDLEQTPTSDNFKFSPNNEYIYAVVPFRTHPLSFWPSGPNVTIKWFYEGEQFAATYVSQLSRASTPVFVSIEPPDLQGFETGQYHVEIYASPSSFEQTIEFQIKQ